MSGNSGAEGLKRLLAALAGGQSDSEDMPMETRLGFFPESLKSPAIRFTPGKSDLPKTIVPAIIFSNVDKGYPEDIYQSTLAQYHKHFGLPIDSEASVGGSGSNLLEFESKFIPIPGHDNKVHAKDALTKVEQSIVQVRQRVEEELKKDTPASWAVVKGSESDKQKWFMENLRIVEFSLSHSRLYEEALEYVLRELRPHNVLFVCTGDSSNFTLFNLMRNAVMKGYAGEIRFYNTNYYKPFGYFTGD